MADLLLGNRGLLVLTPIVVMALVGVVLMRRRGHRAEANVITAVAIAYFVYNIGYWQPFGGGTPGPRFLVPALPFVAVGLAFAYRRLPALTLAMAIPSALAMLIASFTYPLIGEQGNGTWIDWLLDGSLEHTLFTAFGVTDAWLAAIPVLAAIAAAIVLAVRATPATALGDLRPAIAALGAWVVVATHRAVDRRRRRDRARGRYRRARAHRRLRRPRARGARPAVAAPAPVSAEPGRFARPRGRARGLDLVDEHPADSTSVESQAGDRLAGCGALLRALDVVEVEDDAAHTLTAELGDARSVGELVHGLDQIRRELGVDARAAVDEVGEPVRRPQQVAAVVLGDRGGQVKLRRRNLRNIRRGLGHSRLRLAVGRVEWQPPAFDQ